MLDSRLNYLVAVARAGSFTAAAQAAGVTQSAITKSIADLEKEIGYAIFYRTSRGVILTEKGGDFVTRVGRLLEDARELLQRAPTNSDPFAGVLRIGVCPASLEWLLVEPLVELLGRHRSIRYDISSAGFETIAQHLRSGAIDVAVGFDAAFSEWSDLRREPAGALSTTLFVRKGHPLAAKESVTERDLADYDFVTPSAARTFNEIVRSLYERHGIDWRRHVHRVDYFPAVRRLVEESDAIGVVGMSYAGTDKFAQRFKAISGVDLFPDGPLCCAVRARWEPKAAARAFISIVRRSFPGGA